MQNTLRDREGGVGTVMNEAAPKTQNQKDEPAYKRIQRAIRQRIDSGDLKPGDVVDSERELARINRVSLMTARHALADLAQEGIVARRHGAGTFVAPPQILFNKLLSYTEQMGSLGLAAHSRVVSSTVVKHEPEIAARFGLSPTSPLVRIERVRVAGDEPVALEVCYVSDDECHALLVAPLDRTSLFATLERQTQSRDKNENRPAAEYPRRFTTASHPPAYLLNQGPRDRLCDRPLSVGPAYFEDSSLPLSRNRRKAGRAG